MQSALLIILASIPLALILLGCVVLRAPASGPVAMVGAEVVRSMQSRRDRAIRAAHSRLMQRAQPGRFDPLAVNRRRVDEGGN